MKNERSLLLSEAFKERSSYTLGSLLLLVSTILSLAVPWTLKLAVERLEEQPLEAIPYAFGLIGLALVLGVVRVASRVWPRFLMPDRESEPSVRSRLMTQ